MDRAILIFAVLGVLMFAAYLYFIIKTSYDDEKLKKKEKLESDLRESELLEKQRLEEESKNNTNGKH